MEKVNVKNKKIYKKVLAAMAMAGILGVTATVGYGYGKLSNSKSTESLLENTESTEKSIDETIAIEKESTEEEVGFDLSNINELLQDKVLSDILKNMVDTVDKDHAKESLNKYINNEEDISFADLLMDVTKKEQPDEDVNLDDIKYFDNQNGKNAVLPKQLCLFEKVAKYGRYSYYQLNNSKNSFYLITNRAGDIVVIATTEKIYEVENQKLIPFEELLKDNELDFLIEYKYSRAELYNDILFKLNGLLVEPTKTDMSQISKKDVIILDRDKLKTKDNDDDVKYSIFMKSCPYLFEENTTVYYDVYNEENRLLINDDYFFKYYNKSVYDKNNKYKDGYKYLKSLKDFLKEQDINCEDCYSLDDLEDLFYDVNYTNKKGK